MISTNFLLIPTISSPKPLTWLLAARSQFLVFGRPLDLIINEFDLCVANLMIRKCQKHSQKWKIYSFKFMYIHKKRLDLFHQRSQPKSSYFWRVFGFKNFQRWSCIEILEFKSPENLTIWYSGLHSIFELAFLLRYDCEFFLQGLNL